MRDAILAVLRSYGNVIHDSEFKFVANAIAQKLTPEDISEQYLSFVQWYFEVTQEDIESKSRKEEVVLARHCFVAMCMDHYGPTMNISKVMKKVNRTSYTFYHIKDRKENEKYFQSIYNEVKNKYKERTKSN